MRDQIILQPGTDVPAGVHYLATQRDTAFWGRLPCAADEPVLTVDPGDDVVIDTLSHEGILEDQGSDPLTWFAERGVPDGAVLADAVELTRAARAGEHASRLGVRIPGMPDSPGGHGGHVVTGPIAVRGARPGDLLAIRVLEATPRVPYGVISNRHGRGALPGEYPAGGAPAVSVFASVDDDGRGRIPLSADARSTVGFDLAPFCGIMGVAAAGGERPHSVPPGRFGGNLDINLLGAGTTLYLPVQADGALAYVGDPHFAQGDGEVALTAFEASLRMRLRLDLIPAGEATAMFGELAGPLGETRDFLVPTGLDRDLDVAVQDCVRAAIALLRARYGMDAEHAYAYLSAATDFDISQVVDVVKGVHAKIRKSDFGS
ncbi:acetamidase/formamidase family protein [Myceligenerans pegani]|uniref:Acetamidase/formamidase family protein n=1 Tax=Myceligenerans pegani TaxID=2776917 RepID=A0ABR9N384_9MICO|nr:acetamidase/formamidase family protein [Myceligenerans sp. TRM 65318]MBE1877795.1 acetamidase/formamidase family protein [Myceligenerans sp. TRM 65318]MBE3020066.1 acetamidase/formamidase family protein [Myceligenerans sp. TRM 65318]